jgi:hypothetical protein
MFKNFLINIACKFLPVIRKPKVKDNYLLKLSKNDDDFINIDFEKVFEVQKNNIYNFNFIRGHHSYKLTVTKLQVKI